MTSEKIIIDLEGADLKYSFEPDAAATGPVELNSHSYKLSTAGFAALGTAAATWRSSMDGTLEGLSTAITTEIADRIAAITAEEQRVDALIASGMWLFATQADFPAAADNHGRVVHSHADGAIFYAHGGMWHQVAKEVDLQSTIAIRASRSCQRSYIDAEAATRAADTTEADPLWSGCCAECPLGHVGSADPTTATAVAAGDAATLSSANTYTDGEIATEASARTSADASLSGRLDVLETDPTTATAVAAVQSDVDQNEADSMLPTQLSVDGLTCWRLIRRPQQQLPPSKSDVDQNEADSDAADAALSGRLTFSRLIRRRLPQSPQCNPMSTKTKQIAMPLMLLCPGRLDVRSNDPHHRYCKSTTAAWNSPMSDQNEADADAAAGTPRPDRRFQHPWNVQQRHRGSSRRRPCWRHLKTATAPSMVRVS